MIEILKSGLYDTIQDLGRFEVQEFGVPYSGVMDLYSASIANHILDNSPTDAVLEMTIIGPKLLFHCNTEIALSGADLSPKLNNEPILMNTSYPICKGDALSFGQRRYGCRSYLSVKGGFQTEYVMNSRSMYPLLAKQSVFKKRDMLSISETKNNHDAKKSNTSLKFDASHFNIDEIIVNKGMEFNLLSDSEQQNLLSTEFTVSNASNRMAYQVDELVVNNLESIITSLILPGTIQLTPSGKLMILMRDCQVTGGYPRILQVSESSINQLSQKFFGEKFRFKCIDW